MRNLSLPESLQYKVQAYLISTQTTLDQQKEFDSFMNILSPSLKREVTRHIFLECVLNNEIFEGKADIIDIILHDLTTLLFFPEDEICRQGTVGMALFYNSFLGDQLFFLAKGDCDVFINDENSKSMFLRTIRPVTQNSHSTKHGTQQVRYDPKWQ